MFATWFFLRSQRVRFVSIIIPSCIIDCLVNVAIFTCHAYFIVWLFAGVMWSLLLLLFLLLLWFHTVWVDCLCASMNVCVCVCVCVCFKCTWLSLHVCLWLCVIVFLCTYLLYFCYFDCLQVLCYRCCCFCCFFFFCDSTLCALFVCMNVCLCV